jgi:uncharacterized protein with FMN-binding domain
MRRTAPVLLATVVVLVLLANFRTSPRQAVLSTPGQASPTSPTTTGKPPAGASPNGRDGFSSSSSALPSPVITTTSPSSAASRVVDGPVEENRYGPVQVRVTLSGNRIVDVEALQLPSDRSRSEQISMNAGPVLRQEVLQAQSAQVHAVSGATYTSVGYRQSLQAALDQAGAR